MLAVDALLAQEFPVERGLAYLNHAAVAPWPRRTAQAVRRFTDACLKAGARDYPAWVETDAALRRRFAQLIGAPSADIALLKNTSEGLSMVAWGFPWAAGDNVVIPAGEFPSNRIVWESLAPHGVTVRQVLLPTTPEPESALLDACDARTRLLAVSSVQYATGLRLDLARIGEACHARGIAFCVDAIQGLGAFAHDIQAMRIDFLAADGHKWLLGPEGVAVFYCRDVWRERLALHEYGWHMTAEPTAFDAEDWQPAASARRFECGSPNMLGIHALEASLSLLQEIGIEIVAQRILARADHLIEEIRRRPDLELLTAARPGRYAGIVTFRHRQIPPERLFERLRAQGVVCAQRGGGIRFSPHCYNRMETLDEALARTTI